MTDGISYSTLLVLHLKRDVHFSFDCWRLRPISRFWKRDWPKTTTCLAPWLWPQETIIKLIHLSICIDHKICFIVLGRGGGTLVSILSFYSDDTSSNPADSLFLIFSNVLWKVRNNLKEAKKHLKMFYCIIKDHKLAILEPPFWEVASFTKLTPVPLLHGPE